MNYLKQCKQTIESLETSSNLQEPIHYHQGAPEPEPSPTSPRSVLSLMCLAPLIHRSAVVSHPWTLSCGSHLLIYCSNFNICFTSVFLLPPCVDLAHFAPGVTYIYGYFPGNALALTDISLVRSRICIFMVRSPEWSALPQGVKGYFVPSV